jgi:hypothetical protein
MQMKCSIETAAVIFIEDRIVNDNNLSPSPVCTMYPLHDITLQVLVVFRREVMGAAEKASIFSEEFPHFTVILKVMPSALHAGLVYLVTFLS